MRTKDVMFAVLVPALILVLGACARTFPANPTQAQLVEMHEVMHDCLGEIVPLESHYSRTCRNVEDALIAHYGSLSAFLEAQKAYK